MAGKACPRERFGSSVLRGARQFGKVRGFRKMKEFAVLNIVCQPHPEGIYRRLFDASAEARQGVQYYGERYASLSPVSQTRNGVFTGRLANWIEPDRRAKTIRVDDLEQINFAESGVVIPRGLGLNSRVFNFAFCNKHHALVIELTNDENQKISARQARRAIKNLLEASRPLEIDEISVYVRSKASAIDSMLSLPSVRKISIDLKRPNPIDYSDDEEEILREMEEENAKRRKTEISLASGRDTISLIPRHRAMANVAKDNGSVSVDGTDENGEKVHLSTLEMPWLIRRGTDGDSGAVITRNIAESLNEQERLE